MKQESNRFHVKNAIETVHRNQKRVNCEICFDQYHRKYVNILGENSTSFVYPEYTISLLPFSTCNDYQMLNIIENNEEPDNFSEHYVDNHLRASTNRANQLSFMHITTQSMVSTLNQLVYTMNQYSFDVIAMSQTWLNENRLLLNHVNIPGYISQFRNTLGGQKYYDTLIIMASKFLEFYNLKDYRSVITYARRQIYATFRVKCWETYRGVK